MIARHGRSSHWELLRNGGCGIAQEPLDERASGGRRRDEKGAVLRARNDLDPLFGGACGVVERLSVGREVVRRV